MAAPIKRTYIIDVSGDRKSQSAIRNINNSLRKMEGSAKKAQREVRSVGKNFSFLAFAAKAYIALRIARNVTDTSDSMILLGARINIVTEETVGVNKAMSDLFDIANLTRQSIAATGTLYGRLGFATKSLRLDHEELLTIVQGVNNTLLLSGASAQESASSIIQLSQAFSKGSLDGDEFRSVSEGNVILFGIMQEVLGKTARELRQFSRDGELSAKILAEVLTSQQIRALQDRVDQVPLTFDQAFTRIQNSLSQLAISLQPLLIPIAEFFSSVAEGFTADLTIGKGFSEGIISLNQFLIDGNGSLDQRLRLAREVNIELQHGFEIENRAIRDKRLGIDDEREKLRLINKQISITRSGLTQSTTTTNRRGRVSTSVRSAPSGTVAAIEKTLSAQTKIKVALEGQITAAIRLEEVEQKRIDTNVQNAKIFEGLLGEYEKLAKSVRTPKQILDDTLQTLEKFRGLGFDNESAVIDAATIQAWDEYGKAIKRASDELEKSKPKVDELTIAIGGALASATEKLAGSLFDFVTGLESSFSDTITNIINDIGRLIVQVTLLNSIKQGALGGGVASFLFPSANGNVFANGDIQAFANGGVVSSPTFFPLNSGTGVAGEAGPEGILPLKRGSDGKLGVTAEGVGAKSVSVSISNNGTDSVVQEATATTDITGTVVNIVLDDLRRGGPIRDNVKSIGEF